MISFKLFLFSAPDPMKSISPGRPAADVLRFSAALLVSVALVAGVSSASDSKPRLMTFDEISYAGAFTLPADQFGDSSINYAQGVMEVNDRSLFIVGHQHEDAIAEFRIPELSTNKNLQSLKSAGKPVQHFSTVFNRIANGNPEGLNQITGLELVDGSLVVNAIKFYDAPAQNKTTTFVLSDAKNLRGSSVSAVHKMKGAARASGWLSRIPDNWQKRLKGSYISGNSSGDPIISRHSAGPSAFAIDLPADLRGTKSRKIKSRELQGFSLKDPLHADLENKSRSNSLWTHVTHARYGFIVPGTRTYMTVGWSGGHETGVSYKNTLEDGHECPGHCPNSLKDYYNYYWLWDMDDWTRVPPHEIKPYASGEFTMPFQTETDYINEIGGASFDEATGLLYLSVLKANPSGFDKPPVIVAFRVTDGYIKVNN